MNIVDSYGWIEFFANGPLAKQYAPYVEDSNDRNTITPTIVIYEVYKKLRREIGEEKALEAYAQIVRTTVVPLNEGIAIIAADTSLRFGLAMADAVIYASARVHGADLVTSDPHMKGLQGVRFIEQGVPQH